MERPRIAYIVTDSISISLLGEQITVLRDRGFDVTVISNPGRHLERQKETSGVSAIGVPMVRHISLLSDVKSLWRLIEVLSSLRPHIVYAATPKASLLGLVAARLCNVPVRVYSQWGLRLETTTGITRQILSLAEWLTSYCSTHILYVSRSLREVYENLGLAPRNKGAILSEGSSKGVDIDRFIGSPERKEAGRKLRSQAGIPWRSRVAGFVGRFTRDKGIEDLAAAFLYLEEDLPDLHLLMIGRIETEDRPASEVCRILDSHPRIHLTGPLSDVSHVYQAMDFLVLPSYREGFPNVVLEAAAAGLPTIGYRSTGVRDAVVDGVTGALVETGDVEELAQAIARYATDPALCERQGGAALERVKRSFAQEKVFEAHANFYVEALASHPDTAHLVAKLGLEA